MEKFLFSVHTVTEAKQSSRQGGAKAVDLPARSFDLARPGVAPPPIICLNCRVRILFLCIRVSVRFLKIWTLKAYINGLECITAVYLCKPESLSPCQNFYQYPVRWM